MLQSFAHPRNVTHFSDVNSAPVDFTDSINAIFDFDLCFVDIFPHIML